MIYWNSIINKYKIKKHRKDIFIRREWDQKKVDHRYSHLSRIFFFPLPKKRAVKEELPMR